MVSRCIFLLFFENCLKKLNLARNFLHVQAKCLGQKMGKITTDGFILLLGIEVWFSARSWITHKIVNISSFCNQSENTKWTDTWRHWPVGEAAPGMVGAVVARHSVRGVGEHLDAHLAQPTLIVDGICA